MPRRPKTKQRSLRPDQRVERLAVVLHEPQNERRLEHIFSSSRDAEVRLLALRELAAERGVYTSL